MAKKPENTITKIRTGYGDKGETFLVNPNVSKADPLVDFVGTLDEANAFIGKIDLTNIIELNWFNDKNNEGRLVQGQNNYIIIMYYVKSMSLLFDIGAAVHSDKVKDQVLENLDIYVSAIEHVIKTVQQNYEKYQKLNGFIIPDRSNADAMIARAVVRRAEREAVKANCFWAVPALNIMSDFLFLLAWMLTEGNVNQWTGVSNFNIKTESK